MLSEVEVPSSLNLIKDICFGICYIGGLSIDGTPKDTRTPQQKDSLLALIEQLKEEFPNATLHGHNEFAPKTCPCFDVSKEFGAS